MRDNPEGEVIEGRYSVQGEAIRPLKPKREPIIASWKALGWFVAFWGTLWVLSVWKHLR